MVKIAPDDAAPSDGKPRLSDWIFILFLLLSVVLVMWVGLLAYRDGVKTETTKRTGEQWLAWLKNAAETRGQPDFQPEACNRADGKNWAQCLAWLTSDQGPMHGHVNAFTREPLMLALKCDMVDRGLMGALVLERLTPTPPGSAVPVVVEPLLPTDSIKETLNLRVSVCDKGAYPIKIGETDF